jgi:hypothetical protein
MLKKRKSVIRKTVKRKTIKKQNKRKTKTAKRKVHFRRSKRQMRGGNYSTDITTRTLEGYPMKPANKVVTTVPGYGVMSASAYMKLMEDNDRNGKDIYD